MHDVIGHVVIAIGDEDLGAGKAIAAIGRVFSAGTKRADIRSRLRLGELHGAGPCAGYQLFEIDLLQLLAAMRVKRLDRAERQQRTEAERHVRRAPDFGAGRVDCERQALAAERFRSGHRVPAGFGPAPVGVGPAGGGGHLAAFELDAVFIADPVQWRQHVRGETAGFLQHGGSDVAVEIAVMAGFHGGLQARAVMEGQQHVVDRRAVGHVGVSPRVWSSGPPSSHETGLLSTLRWLEKGAGSGPGRAFSGEVDAGSREENASNKGVEPPFRFNRNGKGSSLLKWLNSLYRPCLLYTSDAADEEDSVDLGGRRII